jgi:hypothetical protein
MPASASYAHTSLSPLEVRPAFFSLSGPSLTRCCSSRKAGDCRSFSASACSSRSFGVPSPESSSACDRAGLRGCVKPRDIFLAGGDELATAFTLQVIYEGNVRRLSALTARHAGLSMLSATCAFDVAPHRPLPALSQKDVAMVQVLLLHLDSTAEAATRPKELARLTTPLPVVHRLPPIPIHLVAICSAVAGNG